MTSFIVQNCKKFLQWIQSYEDAPFLDPKWAYLPKRNFFFRKPVNKPCSYPLCLSAFQKSKTDINLFMKYWRFIEYWNLISWEPFLAITWEPDFSQACSFCRILKDNKNFRFTPTPDKTNDLFFLKSPKTSFLALFDHFWHHFFQNSLSLSHITSTILSFRKNYWANSEKTYGQTMGWTDGWKDGPYFIGPFWSWPRVQQEKPQKKSQIKHCLTTLSTAGALCRKYAWCKGDRILQMLEVCDVRY